MKNLSNVVVAGSCKTGKTSVACFLGTEAVSRGLKAFYIKQDYLIEVLKAKNADAKCKSIWNKMKSADLLIFEKAPFGSGKKDFEQQLLLHSKSHSSFSGIFVL